MCLEYSIDRFDRYADSDSGTDSPENIAMDKDESDVFANRDEPVPLLTVTNSDDASTSEAEGDGKRKRLKGALSVSKMKEKMQDISHAQEEKSESSTASPALHERLFAK